jgi:hypothetical protein
MAAPPPALWWLTEALPEALRLGARAARPACGPPVVHCAADLAHELRPDAVDVAEHRIEGAYRVTGAAPGVRVGLGTSLPYRQPGAEVIDPGAERGQGVVIGAGGHRVRPPPGAIPGSNRR